ncbi:VOC family protein [Pelagibacterium halotolerans]|uniref:Glyoxalase/Bleomycin resistance protein/dioxygenase domain protein n=1 Tax=Pelagibacterium halotolerans (strain DSM 22347 / JCM 15775 / CGMCC 1.7692 / B2) TaxID=1082931 RepID=G4R9K7_PELHB|nr:VOC family protein [Pelagibacterium halotolerans]AEQ50427.1 glyoxalase/Bleomycin resistance protein/dioxygenase domain protein [Pelagibacterium halotolerans B2]QJR19606.1 glyoxalase [Pelagibacterium halotolerans]SDZ86864.1 Glyoxalase/Bleomycin resistance protein/Dioxygenase superfamily protein [Pelagibacterium halotolerans]
MRPTSFYPVVMTENVPSSAAFYIENFDFRALFDSDWYVHLQSNANPAINFALLDKSHDTIPEAHRGRTGGLLLSFEVEDVDAQYERLNAAGATVVLDLRDEDFGQRHFIVTDPNGVMIDIIKPIPPSAEFAAQYAQEALPQ